MNKKKLLVAFVLGASVLGGVAFYLSRNVNDLIARYRPELERIAGTALGAEVSMGATQVSLFPSVHVDIQQVKAGGPDGVSLGSLSASLALAPLLQKKIEVTSLSLIGAQIHLERGAGGFKIVGLPQAKAAPATSSGEPSAKEGREHQGATAFPLGLSFNEIRMSGGNITYDDEILKKSYVLKDIDLRSKVAVVAGSQPLEVQLPELHLTGSLSGVPLTITGESLSIAGPKVSVGNLSVNLGGLELLAHGKTPGAVEISRCNLDLASLSTLKNLIPLQLPALVSSGMVRAQGAFTVLPGKPLVGDLGTHFESISVRPDPVQNPITALRDLGGTLNTKLSSSGMAISSDNLELRSGATPMKLSLQALAAAEALSLRSLTLGAFKGTTSLSGTFRPGKQTFEANVLAEHLSAQELLAWAKPELPTIITGDIRRFSAQGSGAVANARALQASTELRAGPLVLVGINLVGKTLEAVQGLPFLDGALRQHVPPSLEARMNRPDTELSDLTLTATIQDGTVQVSNLATKGDLFELTATGTINFEGVLDLKTSLALAPELSTALVDKVHELKGLVEADGRMFIPAAISGTLPGVAIRPDINKLLSRGAKQLLEKHGEDILNKILKGARFKTADKSGESGKKDPLQKLLGF